jgi:hypothetical protein
MSSIATEFIRLLEAENKKLKAQNADFRTALEFAGNEIHGEFCGKEHHEYCEKIEAVLSKHDKKKG